MIIGPVLRCVGIGFLLGILSVPVGIQVLD
jgi:hypothetical protein